jgi:hypothetical protein
VLLAFALGARICSLPLLFNSLLIDHACSSSLSRFRYIESLLLQLAYARQ